MAFAYYNEIDPVAAEWLRWLIERDMIPNGWVDERSICDVEAGEFDGFTQLHFFAGIGGWALAARLAGWPDDRPLVTGSCPCQPFSVAGKGAGTADERHLWPDFFRIIRATRPAVVMGEQVAGKAGYGWFDGVAADLASENYASRYVDIPSCAVDAPHIRSRGYWIARSLGDTPIDGQQGRGLGHVGRQEGALPDGSDASANFLLPDANGSGRDRGPEAPKRGQVERAASERDHDGLLLDTASIGRREGRAEPELRSGRATVAGADAPNGFLLPDPDRERFEEQRGAVAIRAEQFRAERPNGSFWSDHEWLTCHDGKARRTQPSLPLLVDGLPGRVAAWRGFGNAINPVLAAEVIRAFLETE